MAKANKSETVPKAMQEKFDRIIALTDEFSRQHLNEEYAQLIRHATAALCRKRPSPLASGQAKTWACGIAHAIGMVNFLFDSSQDPHISAGNLYQWFGVSSSTGQGKSKAVRDSLKIQQMDPEWWLPSKMGDNPLIWLISVNGFHLDARYAPRELQEIAYKKGLIPYIPGESESPALKDVPKAAKSSAKQTSASVKALYVLDVFIRSGPITEAFVKKNPVISRTLELKGNHTLADLHDLIFKAFDREEEHLYEFQVGGRGPYDPNARRYGLISSGPEPFLDEDELTGDVSQTTLASLGLAKDDIFGYWFDFGDDWWHQINVIDIIDPAPQGKYPRISKREGKSPPQYPDRD
jgi:hypothetical protein